MRIISSNMCKDCSYFIEDCDGSGLCCKDMDYTPTQPNQSACKYFCEEINEYDDIDDYINNEENIFYDDNNTDEDY